jgi:hypothetical protein
MTGWDGMAGSIREDAIGWGTLNSRLELGQGFFVYWKVANWNVYDISRIELFEAYMRSHKCSAGLLGTSKNHLAYPQIHVTS